MGNFDKQEPTAEQIKSLISLITALSKKYNIDPTAKTEYHKVITDAPYMKSIEAGTIAGHKDVGVTSCPGKNLYSFLPTLRDQVVQAMAKGVLVSSTQIMKTLPTVNTVKTAAANVQQGINDLKKWKPAFDKVVKTLKDAYIKETKTKKATVFAKKITVKIPEQEVKKYLNSDISVLLYELSTQFYKRDIACAS